MRVTVDFTGAPADVRVYHYVEDEMWCLEWWPNKEDGDETVTVYACNRADFESLGHAILNAIMSHKSVQSLMSEG